jgi:hypothetical protein
MTALIPEDAIDYTETLAWAGTALYEHEIRVLEDAKITLIGMDWGKSKKNPFLKKVQAAIRKTNRNDSRNLHR